MTVARRHAVGFTGLALIACAAATVGCEGTLGDTGPQARPIPIPPERDRVVATSYPTLSEIYAGSQGIYRGCGPNGNVCHNSRQYPNMNTLGALALTVNQPCNQLQDDPTRIDDWCERQGDTVRVGDQRLLLAYIQRLQEVTDTAGSRWAIVTQGDIPELGTGGLSIVRIRAGGSAEDRLINFDGRTVTRDPMRANAVIVQLAMDDENRDRALNRAGIPAERDAIQFGDPNRNGVFGVGLGNALIVAGHPERSYIIRRLTDPAAGPLMPLANCCFWSKESLRALWCWIAGLNAEGTNAMDPIDYNLCPDGPVENVAYPTPGPTCENGGLCPVHVRTPIPDDPTWANIYSNVIVSRCGGSECHRAGDTSGGLDLGSPDSAYDQLLAARPNGMPARIIPGNPAMSLFYQRLTLACGTSGNCRRMPLGQSALPPHDIGVIAQWITNGARRDGTFTMPDAGGTDASTPPDSATMPDTGTVRDVATMPDTGGGGRDAGMDAGMDVPTD
jgi:hypothetical protein